MTGVQTCALPISAFVEIFQNCNIYNDNAFDFVRDEKENRLYLEHGQPAGETGITHDETDFATAFALSRVIRSLLFNVSVNDPLIYAGVSVVLAVAAIFACWIPAGG